MAELLSLMWNRSMEKTSAALKDLALLGPGNEASHPLLPYIVRSCISLYSTLRFIRVLQLQICLHHFMLSLQIFHLMSQLLYESLFTKYLLFFFYFAVRCWWTMQVTLDTEIYKIYKLTPNMVSSIPIRSVSNPSTSACFSSLQHAFSSVNAWAVWPKSRCKKFFIRNFQRTWAS